MDEGTKSRTAAQADALRSGLIAYVTAMHQAYCVAAQELSFVERLRLPLFEHAGFTVCVVGTRHLHLIATTEPVRNSQHEPISQASHDLRWQVTFLDASMVPALSTVDGGETPDPEAVRVALGLESCLYHLAMPPGSGMTTHHAQHAGTAIAHGHVERSQDYESLGRRLPGFERIVAQMKACEDLGLDMAAVALARHLVPEGPMVADLDISSATSAAARKALRSDLSLSEAGRA